MADPAARKAPPRGIHAALNAGWPKIRASTGVLRVLANMLRFLAALLFAGATCAAGAQDDVQLPDFGSSAGGIISPDEERRIGETLLRELRGLNYILDDPELSDYVESIGYRLVAQSDRPDQPFTFFVVRDESINAFAAPGGYIGVNTGLIVTAEAESELAAVLAHEVAHITQRHLVRAFEGARKASIPIALAMIGAIIAAQGGGSGDAAQAAVVGGTALMQQQVINFTRHNEYEADRIGMTTLHRAEFDPVAMATFFGRMGRVHRANGDSVPEMLRTHPVTTVRVSEAKDRAEAIKRTGHAGGVNENASFVHFRERARVLGARRPELLPEFYERNDTLPADARDYGHGLALARAGRAGEALPLLAPLVERHPGNVSFALALAHAENLAGRRGAAVQRLRGLHAERPDHRAVAIAYADALVESGDAKAAARAVTALRPLVAKNLGDARLQLAFARACELAGDEVRAGEAHAEVALLNGRAEDALGQLNALLKRGDVTYYQRARIEARIAQITPWALEQRRRAVPEEA